MANDLSGVQVGQPAAAPAKPALPSPFADVAAGTVPAVSLAPIQDGKTDAAQAFVVANFDSLAESGLDYHEVPDTSESVIYNPSKITEAQINEAVKAGKLHEIAPLATDLKPLGGDPAAVDAPVAPLSNAVVNGNAGSLETARVKNLTPAPKNTPNPVPGALAKRAV